MAYLSVTDMYDQAKAAVAANDLPAACTLLLDYIDCLSGVAGVRGSLYDPATRRAIKGVGDKDDEPDTP